MKKGSIFLLVTCVLLFTSSVSPVLSAPTNWSEIGPKVSNISRIAISRSQPAVVYAGTPDGFVFRSTDAGISWTTTNDGLPHSFISGMEVHPTDPNTVYVALYAQGIYITRDGGLTWALSSPAAINDGIIDVHIDPSNGAKLFATTGKNQVWRSTDTGQSWSKSSAGFYWTGVHGLMVSPSNPQIIYAVHYTNTFIKSTDGGTTWTPKDFSGGSCNMVVHTTDPNTVFACGNAGGFLKSTDGGNGWATYTNGLPTDKMFHWIVINPQNPAQIWLASLGTDLLYRSDDGGLNWAAASKGLQGNKLVFYVYATGRLFGAGNNAGIYKSTDAGVTWSASNASLPHDRITAVATDPSNPYTLYASSPASGLYVSYNRGYTWAIKDDTRSSWVGFSPLNPALIVSSGPGLLRISSDAGSTWEYAGYDSSQPATVQFDAVDANLLHLALAGGALYTYDLATNSLTPKPSDLPYGNITSYLILPTDPAQHIAFVENSGLFTSTDSGKTWTKDSTVPAGNSGKLAVAPSSPSTLYLSRDDELYSSTDSGSTWNTLVMVSTAPIAGFVVDTQNAQQVTVAWVGYAVMQYNFQNSTAKDLTGGLPTLDFTGLSYGDATNSVLVVTTKAHGVQALGDIPPKMIFMPVVVR